MGQEQKFEQNQAEQPMSLTAKAVSIGFFGGLIWSVVAYFAYLFNFIKYGPAMSLAPFVIGEWKTETLGQIVGIVVIALISILVALFYKFVLQTLKSMWVGVFYGIALWFLVYFVLDPVFPGMEEVNKLSNETIVVTLCIYILYGLFIGYSISFEYHELNQPKDENYSNE